jgi:hypothetical protein
MPKACKKTTKVTPKKRKTFMPKKVVPEKDNGKLLKSEHLISSASLLSPISMVSSFEFLLAKSHGNNGCHHLAVIAFESFVCVFLVAIDQIFNNGAEDCKDIHVFLVAINQIFDLVAGDCKEAFIGQLFNDQT